jgi:hypothetical protein
MIFCGNREEKTDESLISSLLSLNSDELFSRTLTHSSLNFIVEVLTVREPRVNWSEFLQREMRNRGL